MIILQIIFLHIPDFILVGQICSASARRQEDFASHRAVQKSKPFSGGRQTADGAGQGRDKEEIKSAENQETLRSRCTHG